MRAKYFYLATSLAFAGLLFLGALLTTRKSEDRLGIPVSNAQGVVSVPKESVRRALLISIGEYHDKKIPKLEGVDPDVDLMRSQLAKMGFKEDDVVVAQSGGDPFKEDIERAVKEITDACRQGDLLFIMLTSHGFNKNGVDYLVPYDAKGIFDDEGKLTSFDEKTCVSLKQVQTMISSCKASFKWLLVDACREDVSTRDAFSSSIDSLGILDAPDGSIVFQSCSNSERSYEGYFPVEGKPEKHGCFTYYLIEALSGAAADASDSLGRVSMIDAFNYACKKTIDYSKTGAFGPQTPRMNTENFTDFAIFVDDDKVNAEKLYNAAVGLRGEKQYREALLKIEEALRLTPGNEKYVLEKTTIESLINAETKGHIAQAKVYCVNNQETEALLEIDKALALDPVNEEALELKQKAQEQIKNIEKAEALPDNEAYSVGKNHVVDSSQPLPETYVSSNGVEYRLIPHGSFLMGNTMEVEELFEKYGGEIDWYDGAPSHEVTLTRDFYLASRPVTRGEFKAFVEATGYQTTAEKEGAAWTYKDGEVGEFEGISWRNPGFEQTDEHPVVCVSYEDALSYINWLNSLSKPELDLKGLRPEYRLPTEAEWEYACRAGSTTEFFWGDDESAGQGYLNAADQTGLADGGEWRNPFSFNDDSMFTSPVGKYKANAYGLYDMLGNVLEWCSDWHGDYPTEAVKDPTGPEEGFSRVVRGGCWYSPPMGCRSACRYDGDPANRFSSYGFRLAFNLTQESVPANPSLASPLSEPAQPEASEPGAFSSSAPKAGDVMTLTLSGVEYRFHYCPAGTFMMGSPESEEVFRAIRFENEQQHEVKLSRGYWMLETEVTQRMWQSVMGDNPSEFKGDDLPVETVSWEDCQEFISKLNESSPSSGMEFRLPTEAEWEYACRAGSQTAFSWGDALNGDKANCKGVYPYGTLTPGPYLKKTTSVKSYAPNARGLYDMSGNVGEWGQDWGDYDHCYFTVAVEDPTGPEEGPFRVLRGGSWGHCPAYCRCACRNGGPPEFSYSYYGFRLAFSSTK